MYLRIRVPCTFVCTNSTISQLDGVYVFMTGVWRGILFHSMPQTMVEFLDYGGIEQVPTSGLKCLPEKCQHLPFQAIKASLHGECCRSSTYMYSVIE